MTTVTSDNPELLNQLAQEAVKDFDTEPRPEMQVPPETLVNLPGGYLSFSTGELVKTAEVRELTGFDEEKLARIPSGATGRLLSYILGLGTVKIGDDPATPQMLEDLLVGDRDALLVGIRMATYGRYVDMELTCPHCESDLKVKLDLVDDLPVKTLEDQEDRTFEVELRNGRKAIVTMPTGKDQKALLAAADKSGPELNTILLAGCVKTIDDLPVLGTRAIQNLGLHDRRTIVREVAKRAVGPQLGEVNLPCSACTEKIDLPLNLADLFLL